MPYRPFSPIRMAPPGAFVIEEQLTETLGRQKQDRDAAEIEAAVKGDQLDTAPKSRWPRLRAVLGR